MKLSEIIKRMYNNCQYFHVLIAVRKQHIDDSLRVEYTTAADDEVWIPPGKYFVFTFFVTI